MAPRDHALQSTGFRKSATDQRPRDLAGVAQDRLIGLLEIPACTQSGKNTVWFYSRGC